MKRPVKPGLKVIASELGVSAALVSKVLNNRMGNTGVSSVTAAMIRDKARELGYRKNHAAAALVSGKQNVIGGFLHPIGVEGSGIVEQLVRGLAAGAAAHRRRLMLRFFETDKEFLDYLPETGPAMLDGVVIAGVRHPELLRQLKLLRNAGVAIVTLHEGDVLEGEFPNASLDQIEIGRIATEHLIDGGCRRIVHIYADPNRCAGYRLAMQAASLPIGDGMVYTPDAPAFSLRGGERAVAHWIGQGLKFDGIVAQSDHQAVGAMNALLRRGIRVPSDVKIIGVDNSPVCAAAIVPLSSVSGEHYERGRKAVEMLVKEIDEGVVESVSFKPKLYARASTFASDSPLLSTALA